MRTVFRHPEDTMTRQGHPRPTTRHELELFDRGVFKSQAAHKDIPAVDICPWVYTAVAQILSSAMSCGFWQVSCSQQEKDLYPSRCSLELILNLLPCLGLLNLIPQLPHLMTELFHTFSLHPSIPHHNLRREKSKCQPQDLLVDLLGFFSVLRNVQVHGRSDTECHRDQAGGKDAEGSAMSRLVMPHGVW